MDSAVSEALASAIDQVAAVVHGQADVGLLVSCSPTSDYELKLYDGAETKQDARLLSWEGDDAVAEHERGPEATGLAHSEKHLSAILGTYPSAQDKEVELRHASNEQLRRSHAFHELDFASDAAIDSMALSEDEDDPHDDGEQVDRTVRACQDSGASHSEQVEVHDHKVGHGINAREWVHRTGPDHRGRRCAIFPRVLERAVTPKAVINPKPRATTAPSSDATSQSSDADAVRPPTARAKSSVQNRADGGVHAQIREQTRTQQLQLSFIEAERKSLSQRNARLNQQLCSLTADLHRSKTKLSKLRVENELYASKLPQLQAQLLEESAQVDEKDAQSVQSQLQLTQWKARVQVFQTQHDNVGRLNSKLQALLRNCKAELQRKATMNLQQTEKIKMLERDLSSAKTAHSQELLALKQKLAHAVQKGEHDRLTSERTAKQSMEVQVRTAKAKAAKAMKKCDELQALVESMSENQKQLKREGDAAKSELGSQIKQIRTLETLLQKAHRAEASLRSQSASLKVKARAADEQIKQRVMGHAALSKSRKRHSNRIPMELLMLAEDDEDDNYIGFIEDRGHCKCCIQRAPQAQEELQPRVDADSAELGLQLRKAKDEILRLRDFHAQELRAQSAAYAHLLKQLGTRISGSPLPPANNLSGSA